MKTKKGAAKRILPRIIANIEVSVEDAESIKNEINKRYRSLT